MDTHGDRDGLDCRDFEMLAADLLALDEPAADDRTRAQAHRETCDACRDYLQELQQIVASLRAERTPPAPEDLWDRIEARLDHADADANVVSARVWLAACAAALLLLLTFVGIRGGAPDAETEPDARISWTSEPREQHFDPLSQMLLTSADLDGD